MLLFLSDHLIIVLIVGLRFIDRQILNRLNRHVEFSKVYPDLFETELKPSISKTERIGKVMSQYKKNYQRDSKHLTLVLVLLTFSV